jgi:hypothetical protein
MFLEIKNETSPSSSPLALQPYVGPGLLNFSTYSMFLWMSDQPIARPVPTQDNTT